MLVNEPIKGALPTSRSTLNPFPKDVSLSPRMLRLVAQAVVDRRYGFTPASSYAPVLALIDLLPDARAEVDEIERTLDTLEADMEDPVAQFERLTGRVLGLENECPGPRDGSDTPGRPENG